MPSHRKSPLRASQAGVLLSDRRTLLQASAARTAARAAGHLDAADRDVLIGALITSLGRAYCHLLQKRAGYASDPCRRCNWCAGGPPR